MGTQSDKLKLLNALWVYLQTPENLTDFVNHEQTIKSEGTDELTNKSNVTNLNCSRLLRSLMNTFISQAFLENTEAIINRIQIYLSLRNLRQNLESFSDIYFSIRNKTIQYTELLDKNDNLNIGKKSNEIEHEMKEFLSHLTKASEEMTSLRSNLQKEFFYQNHGFEMMKKEKKISQNVDKIKIKVLEHQTLNVINLM